MKRKLTLCVSLIGVLAFAAQSHAISYNFVIDGLQEVPPVATPGTGTGIVDLVDQSGAPNDWLLSWNISYIDLIGTPTVSHIHGPAPVGVNAGVRIDIATLSGGVASPMVGNATISDAFAAELMSGLWYVNIHTDFKPGGEIRGQIVPEPASLAMITLGSVFVLRRRRQKA